MLRCLVLSAALFFFSSSERLSSPSFTAFQSKYKKWYETEEEHNSWYWTFYQNMLKWDEMNRKELGTATYGMNQFSDLSPEEFRLKYRSHFFTGVQLANSRRESNTAGEVGDLEFVIPEAVDWRTKNVVTPVKDQGQCGSCWAFSTVANIEGRWAIKTGDLISLSEQEIVDCDVVDYGCDGGYPWEACAQMNEMGGLVREEDYAYQAVAGECHLNKSQAVVQVQGSQFVSRNEVMIAAHVAQYGPVSALLNAEQMQYYIDGVAYPSALECPEDGIDHAVTIVGYGVEKIGASSTPYWLIKNSWSEEWGEEGYYRLYRGAGVCGINQWISTVVL